MNIKKIGLSALAGSLVAMSAHAADVSLSGGASVAAVKKFDSDKTAFYQNDSITFTVSGETDGGLTVTTKIEMDGDSTGLSAGVDSESITIAHPEMGTVTFAGHGGDSVMGGWDDVTPSAYEEVWDLTKNRADIADFEHALDILDNKRWGENIVVKRSIVNDIENVKILQINSEDIIRLFNKEINTIVMGRE